MRIPLLLSYSPVTTILNRIATISLRVVDVSNTCKNEYNTRCEGYSAPPLSNGLMEMLMIHHTFQNTYSMIALQHTNGGGDGGREETCLNA